ncbi:MmcQ/YjbR family DNA-binding protein, partial [bacterium]|nr:MmcQ/YjbR family DNA-binding protein [bacterium]
LVFRVMGKIFLLVGIDPAEFINLKADPEKAIEWRELYDGVRPGYHMNKKHWNSVYLDGSVPDKEILSMIDHSYELIVQSLKKAEKEKLNSLKFNRQSNQKNSRNN